MNDWTKFSDRLPTEADAQGGHILIRSRSILTSEVTEKVGLWNWIQPTHPLAKETWAANGCLEWRRLS